MSPGVAYSNIDDCKDTYQKLFFATCTLPLMYSILAVPIFVLTFLWFAVRS